MRNKWVKSTFSIFSVTLLLLFCNRSRADDPARLPPQNPALFRFNDAITFYASFDGYATADLSNGKGAPRNSEANWADGIWHQALRGMTKPLEYEALGNIDLTRPGALTMWISPQNWTHQGNPAYIHFVVINSQGITFQISRMGDAVNQEKLYAWWKAGSKGVIDAVGNTKQWQSGWHLLAANWRNGYIEFSVDGAAFHRVATAKTVLYTGKNPGTIHIGAGGNTPYLMDELLIYNRPLENDEVKWMYQSIQK
jgi:hypothetical protein